MVKVVTAADWNAHNSMCYMCATVTSTTPHRCTCRPLTCASRTNTLIGSCRNLTPPTNTVSASASSGILFMSEATLALRRRVRGVEPELVCRSRPPFGAGGGGGGGGGGGAL